ncbi:MATE family efflux transporter, partial [Pseudomonas aeruginosa]|uniref:MATE family efflux transporter n=1 Tax=Pseudomonas aeruginosa TaxID=287 RepID=UPI0031B70EBC
ALIALLRTPIIDLALHIVGGSEAVLEQARRFLEIRWLSAPASLANLVLLGWLLGVQYARAPVILLVVGNILNIVLDVWLVMGLHIVGGSEAVLEQARRFLEIRWLSAPASLANLV